MEEERKEEEKIPRHGNCHSTAPILATRGAFHIQVVASLAECLRVIIRLLPHLLLVITRAVALGAVVVWPLRIRQARIDHQW